MNIADLTQQVDLQTLVLETHEMNSLGKVLCPVHDDAHPSCHIYPDGFKCFACGAHGDAVDWLEHLHGLNTQDALKELKRRAGGMVIPQRRQRPRAQQRGPRGCQAVPVSPEKVEAHRRQAARLASVPRALEGRGFVLADLKRLSIAGEGANALMPITGPDGSVLAIKRRYAAPKDGQRYRYTTPSHGTPAWCSPDFLKHDEVLVTEGELNAAICWAVHPHRAYMGVAGTNGGLHLEALKGRTVFVYADGDEPGQRARESWAAAALEAGAGKVFLLDPWELDACDIAGRQGRAALAERLQ